MAHGEEKVRAVRASFIFDQLGLEVAAMKHGIPDATAKRWKREAKAAGDDWDKARSAQMIAGGGIEDVVRQTLTFFDAAGNASLFFRGRVGYLEAAG